MMKILNKIRVFFQFQRGMLFQYGWLRSFWRDRPVDQNGKPLPWITYPAIDFLSQFDFSECYVFEWGSGFSTLWWSERCRQITTVESNETWIPYIQKLLPNSVQFITTPLNKDREVDAFVGSDRAEYDVIVIDNNGPYRAACAEAATKKLALGGIVLLDNSDQCLETCQVLRKSGLVQIDFTGYVPGAGYAQSTSIFFRNSIKFKTRTGIQPARSVAQPNEPWPGC